MSDSVEFYLTIQTDEASQDEAQGVLVALARELEAVEAEVTAIAPESAPAEMLEKGNGPGSLLDVKIDLEALRSLGTWIYQRLTPGIKVKMKHRESEFEFVGRNQQELATGMALFEQFVNCLEEKN